VYTPELELKLSYGVLALFVLVFTISAGFPRSQAQELFSLPAPAIGPDGSLIREAILESITPQQAFSASPGETISLSATFYVWTARLGENVQVFLVVSWSPSWPPTSGFYVALYEGAPGTYPGIRQTRTFTLTVPTSLRTFYVWFCRGAAFNMQQAISGYEAPLTIPAHVKITVRTTPITDFGIAATSSQTVTQGQLATYVVMITAGEGFHSPVALSISGLPGGTVGVFSPTMVVPNSYSTLTVATGASTLPGTYNLVITGVSGSVVRSTAVLLGVQPSASSSQSSSSDHAVIAAYAMSAAVICASVTIAVAVVVIGRQQLRTRCVSLLSW